MSFFSADAHPRALTDLEGVLCARGQLSVFGRGSTARLSIVLGAPPVAGPDPRPDAGDPRDAEGDATERGDVERNDADHESSDTERDAAGHDDSEQDARNGHDVEPDDALHEDAEPGDAEPDDALHEDAEQEDAGPELAPDPVAEWRAHALCCAFRTRGVDAEVDRLDDGRPVVRSAYRADLVPLARAWTRGAIKAVPADLDLDGPRLRLWVLAAGRRHGPAYLLGLDPHAPRAHRPLLAASTRAGLGATLGGDRAEPVLRIVGRRRQARLAELIGDAPRSLAEGIWPG